jgi:hypothetical protein
MTTELSITKEDVEQWLAIRKEAATKIDPETAEVDCRYGYPADPYGVHHDLHPDEQVVGPVYFARSAGSEIWVSFYDLPEGTVKALWHRIDAGTLQIDWGLEGVCSDDPPATELPVAERCL